ncbi:phage Gp37/Gp68 family protein [Brevibacillus reuszeri]|uniref:phage Gp37/Gp68 family protein n=1 Tax=Brevibacillus reuszeri TaxID=54915 RepID=UPI000CCC3A1D|nr:phage Gp37/Gp68 family protein [Brevibacillus reuszeri]
MTTAIEWTDTVWNPVTGCSKVSEGCRNCYAFALHDMRHKAFQDGKKLPQQYAKPFNEIQLFPDRLLQPLKWRKPRRVFVNSMSDLFHESVPFEYIDEVFEMMAESQRHTFQILTKRPQRMLDWFNTVRKRRPIPGHGVSTGNSPFCTGAHCKWHDADVGYCGSPWPLPNVWIGTSVENQKAAEERIPLLLQVPAEVRFLSCEPLLGYVDLEFTAQFEHPDNEGYGVEAIKGIDWIIAGGESGINARPMHENWIESLRDQCQEYGVPFFFKQWGEFAPHGVEDDEDPEYWVADNGIAGLVHCSIPSDPRGMIYMNRVGKKRAGRMIDGQEWNQFPDGGERDASRT